MSSWRTEERAISLGKLLKVRMGGMWEGAVHSCVGNGDFWCVSVHGLTCPVPPPMEEDSVFYTMNFCVRSNFCYLPLGSITLQVGRKPQHCVYSWMLYTDLKSKACYVILIGRLCLYIYFTHSAHPFHKCMSVFVCIIVTTVFILNCLHCICSVCVFVCVHSSYIWLFILVSFVCVAADLKQRKLESWEWQLDASWTWSHTHHWHHGHVCMIVVYCNYTMHVFTHNTCMHLPSACMHTSLACSIRCSWCG